MRIFLQQGINIYPITPGKKGGWRWGEEYREVGIANCGKKKTT